MQWQGVQGPILALGVAATAYTLAGVADGVGTPWDWSIAALNVTATTLTLAIDAVRAGRAMRAAQDEAMVPVTLTADQHARLVTRLLRHGEQLLAVSRGASGTAALDVRASSLRGAAAADPALAAADAAVSSEKLSVPSAVGRSVLRTTSSPVVTPAAAPAVAGSVVFSSPA